MDVTITIPKKLLEQMHFVALVAEAGALAEAVMTARWEAERPLHALDQGRATRAACRLEKAAYCLQWLRDAVVAA